MKIQARDRLLGQLSSPTNARNSAARTLLLVRRRCNRCHRTSNRGRRSPEPSSTRRKRSLHGHRDPLVPDLMGGQTVDPRTVQPDAAVCRPLQADDDLQERALRPVRTDDGDDVAVVDPERDAVDGRETAESLGDRVDLEEQARPPLRPWAVRSQRLRLNSTLGHQLPDVFSPRSGGGPWSGWRTAVGPPPSRPTAST